MIGRSVISLPSDIFKCMLGAAPGVGPLSEVVARPDSSLDVGLDFQAQFMYNGVCFRMFYEYTWFYCFD